MPQQTPSRPLAEQAAQLAEAIIFELLGTPRPLELLSRLGVVWAKLGKPERAQKAFLAATATLSGMLPDDTPGARLGIEYACTLLGRALALSGKADQVRQLIATTPGIDRDTVLQRVVAGCTDVGALQESFVLALAIQDPTTQEMVLEPLAKAADESRQFALRDQAIARMRDPLRRADTLYHIARRRLENRAFAEARALLRKASHAVRATRKLPERADWLARLATALIEAQAPQEALLLLAEAEALLPKLEPYTRVRVGCQIVQGYARAGETVARTAAAPADYAAYQAGTRTGAGLPASILRRSPRIVGELCTSRAICALYQRCTHARQRLAVPRTRLTGGESAL
jgi:tetratricopeptide (TPR) repeat protein